MQTDSIDHVRRPSTLVRSSSEFGSRVKVLASGP
jgi:hypothetical protein